MNVVLNVKNTSKIIKPSKNNVLLYDGKDWYITTKERLFEEWTSLLNECNDKLALLDQQNAEFKNEVNSQLREMTELIHRLFEVKGENL